MEHDCTSVPKRTHWIGLEFDHPFNFRCSLGILLDCLIDYYRIRGFSPEENSILQLFKFSRLKHHWNSSQISRIRVDGAVRSPLECCNFQVMFLSIEQGHRQAESSGAMADIDPVNWSQFTKELHRSPTEIGRKCYIKIYHRSRPVTLHSH